MGLFTRPSADDYAGDLMPGAEHGTRPWGKAIEYWIRTKGVSQADLVRSTKKGKNTISRATRGLDVHTSTLVAIAKAFKEPIEVVLVSPEWLDRQDAQKRVIQSAVEEALRSLDHPPILLSPAERMKHAMATLQREMDEQAEEPKPLPQPATTTQSKKRTRAK